MLSAAPFSRSPDRNRVAILVMGMHRSGTSALAWLLGQMGATLPRDEMPASAENAKGYWESSGLVKADEQLIRAAGSSWFDPRPLDLSRIPSRQLAELLKGIQNAIDHGWGDASLLAIKDPRQCRFVPTIVAQLEKMGIAARAVLMLRNAAEVAASIARRDATTASYAQLLWLRHMLDAERDTRALPRTIVSYDGLMGNWRTTATRLAPLLGCEGWSPDDDGATIEAYLDQNLRHHHLDSVASQSHEIDALIAAAEHGFAALTKADDTSARAVLDQVRARLAATPWLEGDVVHDELRHRRVPAVALSAPEPSEMDASSQEPPPPFNEVSDPESDVALIRSSGLFDTTWYCGTYLEVQESGLDPIEHYLRVGAAKGYNPNPLFDTGYYARQMARRSGSESL